MLYFYLTIRIIRRACRDHWKRSQRQGSIKSRQMCVPQVMDYVIVIITALKMVLGDSSSSLLPLASNLNSLSASSSTDFGGGLLMQPWLSSLNGQRSQKTKCHSVQVLAYSQWQERGKHPGHHHSYHVLIDHYSSREPSPLPLISLSTLRECHGLYC